VKLGRLPVRPIGKILSAAAVLALLVLAQAGTARADEQRVSRLGIAISAMVTTFSPDWVNDGIDRINHDAEVFGSPTNAVPKRVAHMKAAGFFQAEGRFFISDHVVAVAGAGKLSRVSQVEILPGPGQRVLLRGKAIGVPRHLGLAYYFTPHTRGDFTVRPFAGGGFMDVVEAKARVGAEFENRDTLIIAFTRPRGEGPGYYAEAGVHLMLPSNYSFIINLNYHHIKASPLQLEGDNGELLGILTKSNGEPENLDFSGIGLRFAVNINLKNKF
jgi:hypothetical protein